MCTVTYIPQPGGFVLTHNRDEAPTRSPQAISRENIAGQILLFPRDTKAGGTWIVSTRNGDTACLLNGAFVKHEHRPPYRRSRGLMLLDFFACALPDDFFNQYDLTDIEPFTLLLFQPGRVAEFRWDGAQRYLKNLSVEQSHFWCSATLYPPDMQEKREQVFRAFLHRTAPHTPSPAALLRLHRTGSVGDPLNDYVMNRDNRVRTVSITQVVQQNKNLRMRYFDLLENSRSERRMYLR